MDRIGWVQLLHHYAVRTRDMVVAQLFYHEYCAWMEASIACVTSTVDGLFDLIRAAHSGLVKSNAGAGDFLNLALSLS